MYIRIEGPAVYENVTRACGAGILPARREAIPGRGPSGLASQKYAVSAAGTATALAAKMAALLFIHVPSEIEGPIDSPALIRYNDAALESRGLRVVIPGTEL